MQYIREPCALFERRVSKEELVTKWHQQKSHNFQL